MPINYLKEVYIIMKDTMPREIASGVYLAGRFGEFQAGSWILVNGNEAVIVEMPHYDDKIKNNPVNILKNFVSRYNLKIKFITATHNHGDHIFSINKFHRAFPEIPIIFHSSFISDRCQLPSDIEYITPQKINPSLKMTYLTDDQNYEALSPIPLYLFNSAIFAFPISGEYLYLIYAPKHSYSDIMIIFRGTMISGDWWIGKGDPNWSNIPNGIINRSIDTILDFSRKNSYRIERIFSAHADNLLYDVDFDFLMKETRPL